MDKDLILKRATARRPSGVWNDDDSDVLAEGAVVGRIFNHSRFRVEVLQAWQMPRCHRANDGLTHNRSEALLGGSGLSRVNKLDLGPIRRRPSGVSVRCGGGQMLSASRSIMPIRSLARRVLSDRSRANIAFAA
jgi:hypothetical protein